MGPCDRWARSPPGSHHWASTRAQRPPHASRCRGPRPAVPGFPLFLRSSVELKNSLEHHSPKRRWVWPERYPRGLRSRSLLAGAQQAAENAGGSGGRGRLPSSLADGTPALPGGPAAAPSDPAGQAPTPGAPWTPVQRPMLGSRGHRSKGPHTGGGAGASDNSNSFPPGPAAGSPQSRCPRLWETLLPASPSSWRLGALPAQRPHCLHTHLHRHAVFSLCPVFTTRTPELD